MAPAGRALASLKRCRPGRPPIYRDGDRYALDPYDHETDLWAFRLGLRPPRAPALRVIRPSAGTLPSPDEPLTVAQIDEAWRDGLPSSWSAQRTAICVLDAHRRAMQPAEVLAFVRARSEWSPLSADSAKYWRRGAAILVRDDGLWQLTDEHDAVRSARLAVGERIEMVRRWAEMRPDPAVMEANRKRFERAREANAERLARMRRVVIHPFPAQSPEAVVLVDVGRHEITTFMGRGRVAAVSFLFVGASNELGEFESGVTARLFGPAFAAVLGGVASLLVTALWWKLFPALRRVHRLE